MSDQVRNALATRDEKAPATRPATPTVAQALERQQAAIQRALPAGFDADRFTRIVLTEVRRTPKLKACTVDSLLASAMLSAQLGLEPGPLGHAYLVPRRNKGVDEVQFQIGYKGYIELARRSGQIESLEAREVCEHDEFDFEYGLDPKLRHKPTLGAARGKTIAYYGVAKFKGGGYYFLVMSREDIEKRRQRSSSKDSGPWISDYDAMARKTVVRAMAPFLPLSAEVSRLMAADGAIAKELVPNLADEVDPSFDDAIDAEVQEPAGELEADPAVEGDSPKA